MVQHHKGETQEQRLDRNWQELLQELRVVQTGVQILTGFLLTVPFAAGFERLDQNLKVLYVCILGSSVLATSLLVSPVAFHRTLFRRGERAWLVHASHLAARAGLAALAVTIVGVVYLIFAVVIGHVTATVGSVVAALLFLMLWVVVPISAGRHLR